MSSKKQARLCSNLNGMNQNIERVAVIGAGGVGGYFGGRLAESGVQVHFLARGATLQALKERGLVLKSIKGDASVPVYASDSTQDIGPVDLVLVALKAWQLPEVLPSLPVLLHEHTVVLPLLNGIGSVSEVSKVIPEHHVLGGLCRIISSIEAPGVIAHTGAEPSVTFGEISGVESERVQSIASMFRAAGVTVDLSQDIQRAIWEKALFVCSLSALGAVTRAPFGELRAVPETRNLLQQAMEEVHLVGRAAGVNLPDDLVLNTMSYVDSLPADGTSSLQRDVMAGRPSELEAQLGDVVRAGQKHGVPTPVFSFCHQVLLPQEIRSRQV